MGYGKSSYGPLRAVAMPVVVMAAAIAAMAMAVDLQGMCDPQSTDIGGASAQTAAPCILLELFFLPRTDPKLAHRHDYTAHMCP